MLLQSTISLVRTISRTSEKGTRPSYQNFSGAWDS
jgi:hypothetical protein